MTAVPSEVDGGWAWLVCGAGCFIHIFIMGHVRCTGILLAAASEQFGSSKRNTSWIMGIMMFILLVSSPITMSVAKRTSARLVTLVGSLCLCFSFSISYFATSLQFLYVTVGALTGLSMSLMHPPTLLLVNLYFDKYRTVATGFTLAGCSIGALCMPPLLTFLLEQFAFRGALLLWGGVMLHTFVACLLLRSFVPAQSEEESVQAEAEDTQAETKETRKQQLQEGQEGDAAENDEKQDEPQTKQLLPVKSQREFPSSSVLALSSCGDVSVLPQKSIADRRRLRRALLLPRRHFDQQMQRLKETRRLLRNPRLWVLMLALSFASEGMPMNYLMIPQHAEQLGFTRSSASLLIQLQGITDFFARVSIGFVIDRGVVRLPLLMWLLAFAQSGLWLLLILPVMQSYAGLMTFALLEGVVGGSLLALLVPCLVAAFGVDSLPISFGCTGVFQSVVMLLVPPLLGELRDRSGEWYLSLAAFGGMVFGSALLLLFDDAVLRRCYDNKKSHDDHHSHQGEEQQQNLQIAE